MRIEPPAPNRPETVGVRRRLGYMTTFIIGIAVILLVTLAAWITLWGGGVKRAQHVETPTPASSSPK